MELELEDGTVLEVPDDMDPEVAYREYKFQQGKEALKTKDPSEYDPTSNQYKLKYGAQDPMKVKTADMDESQRQYLLSIGMSPNKIAERFGKTKEVQAVNPNQLAGVGSGLVRTVKGLTNLALPDSITPEFASDENIKAMDERDKELPFVGKTAGSIAASYPLSMGIGAALGAGSQAAGGGTALGRTLASPWLRAPVEGAVQGAIYADPDKQAEGAVGGALFATALHGGLAGGSKLARGLVEKSEAAKELEQLAAQHGEEIFLPVSQAASEEGILNRLMKAFYKEALPIIPGVRGKVLRQNEAAAEKLREIALREGMPTGGTLPAEAGKKVSPAIADIQKMFDDAYDQTIKSYAFNVPKTLKADVAAAFQAKAGPKTTVNAQSLDKVSDDVQSIVDKYAQNGVLDGTNLLNAKREISDLLISAKGQDKLGYQAADELLDDIVEQELKVGNIPQNLADLKRYQDLTPAYRAFQPVRQAAKTAPEEEGRFLFRTLARKATRSPEQRDLGRIGAQTIDKSPVTGGITGKILAGLGTGGAGFGAFMSPAATAGTIVGGNVLASRGAQKLILGDTRVQKALAEALRRNPELKQRLETVLRTGAISEIEGE